MANHNRVRRQVLEHWIIAFASHASATVVLVVLAKVLHLGGC